MKTTGPHSHLRDESPEANERVGAAALDWAIGSGTAERVMREVGSEVRRVRRRRIQAAAGGAAALLLAGFVGNFAWGPRLDPPAAIAAGPRASAMVLVPAQRVLPDGSVAQLKDGALIDVRFSDATRLIVLLRGEVHFDVARNGQRPFVVIAGGVETRAVGTAFSVLLGAFEVEVLVTEGLVTVAGVRDISGGPPQFPPAIVEAGNRALVEIAAGSPRPSTVEAVTPAERDEKLSWRIPRLEFTGTPLAEVIRLFQQHSGARIVLSDAALGRLQVSGVLRADSVDSLLRLLEIEFGIKAERRSDAGILLQR